MSRGPTRVSGDSNGPDIYDNGYGRRVRADDERGKLIAYLDNATIINSCSLLTSEPKLTPYNLLDLEGFCQAFLLYDCVRTLVGSSFSVGFSGGYSDSFNDTQDTLSDRPYWVTDIDKPHLDMTLLPPQFESSADVYHYLIDGDFLRPVVKGAGTVHYYIENIKTLDEIAARVGVTESVALAKQFFSKGLPWSLEIPDRARQVWSNKAQKRVERSLDKAATSLAANSVIVGSGAWTSDSYPIYYFSVDPAERRERDPKELDWGWEINNNRITTWESTMVSQTFFYVIESSIAGKPFIGSSIRTPIIIDLAARLNFQFQMVVQSCLSAVDKSTRNKVERINRFFGKAGIKFSFLPALFCVLREARSREDFIPALFRLRNQTKFREFREWCCHAESAWEAEDVNAIYSSLCTITEAVHDISRDSGITPVGGSISHIGDPRLLTEEGVATVTKNSMSLGKACYSPGMTVIRDFAGYLSQGRQNLENLEALFEQKLNAADRSLLSGLSQVQRQLHPSGDFGGLEDAITRVEMEVVMGDKFEGISVSGQGIAIGRGAQADVRLSNNALGSDRPLNETLAMLAETVRKHPGQVDSDVEATLVQAAAMKAQTGDEAGAAAILKKSSSWVLDLAKSAGSAVLAAFLKAHLGIQ
jgi:hypothetical protein